MTDIPTEEDKNFIVEDGYNHDEDPTQEPEDSSSSDEDNKYVVTGKEFKKLAKKAKNSVLNRLIIQLVKIINMQQHFQLERKFILSQRNIQTF